ncbi:Translation elongation factor 1 beta [Nowakowskiella sp. JEL0407]|nr:Translation elongation factor 1 beta [Nowakowskiella sp. JEL0407]
MGFASLDKPAGLAVLNSFLEDKSYIEGYTATQADVAVFEAVKTAPSATEYPYAARWFSHIKSFAEKQKLPGTKKAASAYGPASAAPAEEEEEDVDLFGSDDEVDEEAERIKAQRLAEYQEKKKAKPKPAAKSMVILDVKPWDDETDMKLLEDGVRAITMDGLVWGTSKLVAVGYGIKKLQITCVVEDDKVGVDDLSDQITGLEDYVQSVDVAAFNKL